MNLLKRSIILFFIIASITITSSCGKYSEPLSLERSGYPHNYPHYEG